MKIGLFLIIILLLSVLFLYLKNYWLINKNATYHAMKVSSYFDSNKINDYQNIDFVDRQNFAQEISSFLDKNYTSEEINLIYEYLSDSNIQKLLNLNYIDLKDFYQISNIDVLKINDYLEYQNIHKIPIKEAVTEVNLHLNEEFYSNVSTIKFPDSYTILVNKYNALPSNYYPKDLTNIGNTSLKMRARASRSLENLIADALTNNIVLIPFSAYRSYDYQEKLYNKYLETDPIQIVDTYSARAGHSEHQTGLACDIRSDEEIDTLTPSDYKWLLDNSYKYGFIVRYPKGKSKITGYKEEPWHLRYVGETHSKKIHDLNITFDEYYDLYLTNR